jgi:L-fucose dehydrogenase
MDLRLNGKVIPITGGAKGICAAIVQACAHENAVLVILDRDQLALQEQDAELQTQNVMHETVMIDLRDSEAIRREVPKIARKFGRIDGLVNNAGVNDSVGLEAGTPDRFAASLDCNLVHYYTMAQAVLPFLKQSRGSIVNLSSKVAVTGQGGTSGYAAAKGAILALTREWAFELSSFGVRTNAVVPAEVMTPQYQEWVKKFNNPEERLRQIATHIPLERRMTEPEEIANMVVFLLSSQSNNMTGQFLFVDGGYVHLDRALTS